MKNNDDFIFPVIIRLIKSNLVDKYGFTTRYDDCIFVFENGDYILEVPVEGEWFIYKKDYMCEPFEVSGSIIGRWRIIYDYFVSEGVISNLKYINNL